jgi:asparagine N-glycosylation enzyme membrane subunit Stt3
MKKSEKIKHIITIVLLILIILGIGFSFRYIVAEKVVDQMGDGFVDPETDVPYLTEMDSYYHQRMTRNIDENGHPGDMVVNGESWDSLRYAPEGKTTEGYRPLMSYIAIYTHKILALTKDISLEQVIYWLPPFVAIIVIIPVFLFVYRLKGAVAASVAGVLSGINYGYLVHTVPGFFDTDAVISWTSCFVFLFGCLLVAALERKSPRKGFIYFALFALSMFLLICSWYVYYMFAGIFALALVLYAILKIIFSGKGEREGTAKELIPVFIFIGLISIFVLIMEPGIIGSALSSIKGVFNTDADSLFPNAYVSVSELRKPALIAGGLTGLFQMRVLSESNIGIINAVGGIVPFLGALSMLVLMIVDVVKKRASFEYILLILWTLITAVLAFRSWRFIMLFAVPVAVLAGLFTGTIVGLMSEKKMMDWKIFAGMIMILMLFPALYGAYRSSSDSLPVVNRYLHATLAYIDETTPQDTVLESWWDYGYFYEEKAKRATLFDGGSQDGKRVYWVSRALAGKDETLACNILRMLAGSGDKATDKVLEVFGEKKSSLSLMEELLRGGREKAVNILGNQAISEADKTELLELLYPTVSSDPVFVVTSDMSGIATWFARFGYEDEEKYADMAYAVLMDRSQYSDTEGPSGWRFASDQGEMNLVIEKTGDKYKAYTASQLGGDKEQPYPVEKVIVVTDTAISTIPMEGVNIPEGEGYTVVINKTSGDVEASLATSLLTDSVFGKMYYEAGTGLKHFARDERAPGAAQVFYVR